MARSAQPIPEGLRTVTPQIVVADGKRTLEFLGKAFGAETLHSMPGPDGKGVMHAAVRLGDCTLFVSDAGGFAKPTAANLFVYVADVDAAYKRATDAGAKPIVPVSDMFWGDRWGMVEDPSGNRWQLATHVEDVPPGEMAARMAAAAKK